MENKKVVLITEDDKSLRGALHIKLSNEGFDVLEAKDGDEGLMIAILEHPDIILLDLAMPKLDGLGVLKNLREDAWGKTVPVIILTNVSGADDKINKEITALEPTYYFVKTEKSLEDIVEKIKERLSVS